MLTFFGDRVQYISHLHTPYTKPLGKAWLFGTQEALTYHLEGFSRQTMLVDICRTHRVRILFLSERPLCVPLFLDYGHAWGYRDPSSSAPLVIDADR